MNIENINVGDILVWTSPVGTYSEVVMVIEKFRAWETKIKVKVVSTTREDRIGKLKIFTQKTLNHRRSLEPLV